MRLFIKILLGLALFVTLVFAAAMYATSGIASAADDFIEAIGSNDMDTAYSLFSAKVQAKNNKADFAKYVQETPLADFESAKWHSREIVGNEGVVAGNITLRSGETMQAQLDFLKEDGEWKIYSFNFNPPE